MAKSATAKQEAKRPRRRRRWLWYLFWTLMGLFGLTLGALLGYLSFAGEGTVRRAVVAYIRGETKPENAFPGKDRITVLIVGADENRDRRKRVVETAARTDTIVVAQFDFKNQRISALSIPRDTLVRIPRHGWGKINAAHVLGGPQLLVETVSQLLGNIRIDHVVIVSYKAFEEAVDALGGVWVDVEKPMHYHDNWGDLHIDLEPGLQLLNGKQALGYVRFRHSDSDFHRIERQQKFMRAVKERLKDPSVWLKAPNALSAALRHIRTTMEYEQMLALALFARQLPDTSIRTETLPVRDGRGTNLLVNREKARELLQELGFWDDGYLSYAR
ncbi:MAG: LCP family protein [Armatimonadetes bacterium]|nr:LCP family protein [Armatimonadota bacterium]